MIDAKRRSFLWTGEKTCSGGHCKAPWDLVCIPKDKGGLDVKDLHGQNRCLLQKFLSKLHQPASSPCQTWFQNNYGWNGARDLGDPHRNNTPTWTAILQGLDNFREITAVIPGDGSHTSFWFDRWIDDCVLANRFPALFSHSTRVNISVAHAISSGDFHLRNRLSSVASSELSNLLDLLSLIQLTPSDTDYRHLRGSASSPFSTAASYSFAFAHLPSDLFADNIWKNLAPSRCRSFLWQTHHHKINTNDRLPSG